MDRTFGTTRLTLVQGDITRQSVGAVVNAANPSLLGGGGVDGAIHRAGGPTIVAECQEIAARLGRLEPGRAVVTAAGNLLAGTVIHAVGPVWRGGDHGEADVLARAYSESLRLAEARGIRLLATPSLSTGAYGYPVAEAARIAVGTVATHLAEGSPLLEVRFVLYTAADLAAYRDALAEL